MGGCGKLGLPLGELDCSRGGGGGGVNGACWVGWISWRYGCGDGDCLGGMEGGGGGGGGTEW